MHTHEIRHVSVVGVGRMGHGIGQTFATAGYPVVFHDVSAERVQGAVNNVRHNLHELAEFGIIAESEIQPALDRITTTTSLERAGADADLVIEAVFEDLALKQDLFRELDAICPSHTILGSNTSSLMPTSLATATNRPDRVLVIHYFYPPPLLPLVEVVRGEQTSDETVDTVFEVLRATGMNPVLVRKEAVGFIANRIGFASLREALHIVEQGIATAQDVDTVMKLTGRRSAVSGPFESLEVKATWDLVLAVARYIMPELSNSTEDSPLLLEKVERGELGAETGKGFYEWTPESAAAWQRRLTEALIEFLRERPTGT